MAGNVIPLRSGDDDREVMAELAVMEIVRRMARAEKIEAAAQLAMAKVAEHERCGYERITLGAFTELREALEDGR